MHFPRMGGNKSPAAAPASGGASSSAAASTPEKGGADMTGSFDPDTLERGATALKEIDNSKNAKLAFDLATIQEQTVQLDKLKEAELQRLYRTQIEEQLAAVQAEELRKTISHVADQERSTAQYKAEVESSLQGRKLDLQKAQLEYQLKREAEQFQQHEQMRIQNEKGLEEVVRETIRLKAVHDRESAISEAKAAAAGAAKQQRENIEVRLREMRAEHAETRATRMQTIEETFQGLSAGFAALYEDPSKGVALVGAATCLALGVYSARSATRVAGTLLEKHLGRPPLVRETSRWTWRPELQKWNIWATKDKNLFQEIVVEDSLAERLQWTTNALLSAQENGTPFRHLLLYGQPGTGKTLFARTLAKQSGLDYAIMSGGDLGPLGHEGPQELHKLFNWANRSKRGLVLFVDEADAFLRKGRGGDDGMSEDARNALSVFLHHTGTESARVAVILATNVPSVLDRAVIDRIDEAFEFPMPAQQQRLQMLELFFARYLHKPTKRGKGIEVDEEIDIKFMEEVARKTDGFSGRQLAKLVLAFQSSVFGSGTMRLTKGLADTVLSWRLTHKNS